LSEVKDIENVVIVGSGPAGYTAALYTSRADLEPLVVEGFAWGGLLQQTTDVENYPGYPEGVLGPEMMQQFRDQAERFGTRFLTDDATRLDLSRDGGLHTVIVGDREIRTKTVILAMGAEPKKLGVPGEEELAARGVSYCATCDAAFFRGKPTIVVGGGDTAMEDAIFLSKFASNVTVVHRRDQFRASAIMVDRARDTDNIEFLTPYIVERFDGGGDGSLGRAVLCHRQTGENTELEIDGAFIAIGHRPNSQLVEGQVMLDESGYVLTGHAAFSTDSVEEARSTRTNVRGVFAAGDLVDHTYRQAVTAAGTGCMAALDAEWYLRDTPPDAEAHWAPAPEKVEQQAEAAAS
jgi:thioredoxin reductase (NADPH)